MGSAGSVLVRKLVSAVGHAGGSLLDESFWQTWVDAVDNTKDFLVRFLRDVCSVRVAIHARWVLEEEGRVSWIRYLAIRKICRAVL